MGNLLVISPASTLLIAERKAYRTASITLTRGGGISPFLEALAGTKMAGANDGGRSLRPSFVVAGGTRRAPCGVILYARPAPMHLSVHVWGKHEGYWLNDALTMKVQRAINHEISA
jgi:hypothetical protein